MQLVAAECLKGVATRKRSARSMWRSMSTSTPRSLSEGIDRVPRGRRTQVGFQGVPIDHINRTVKQTHNVILQPDVIEHGDVGLRIDVDHNVEVTVRTVIAARD